uniref:BTB/POZ and MATH domain-containing protein 3 n=1 Tax=Kalanchoe fedtschenkoi TaxID=63787 RepID=A0A7N0V5N0_KALFE
MASGNKADTLSSGSSESIIDTVNGSHDFTIKGYSLAKGMGPGKYISSDVFSVGGYDWAIYFYPDGKNPEDNSMYVSVFIALASEGTDVRVLFKLTLLDQSGKGKHRVHSHFDRALEGGPYTLKYKGSMWGYKRFFKRQQLEDSDYLKDDSIALTCTVGIVRMRLESQKHYNICIPPSNMGQNFLGLLESEVGCDVVFRVGDEVFKAHKLILAARSPVFKAQFFGHVGNPKMDLVEIEDVEPVIFKAMLLFIYSDKYPDIHQVIDSMSMRTSTFLAQHLLAAADRFDLDRLKLLCEAKLCEEVNVETVSTTLALAEHHGCKQLKAICLKFATNPDILGDLMHSDGYKKLEEICPSLISELLNALAEVDANPSLHLSWKRSSSSFQGADLGIDGGVNEATNQNGRRTRRRA